MKGIDEKSHFSKRLGRTYASNGKILHAGNSLAEAYEAAQYQGAYAFA